MELGTYTHTAICTQEAEVLVLNMKNYERLVQKRNPRTIETMREIVETKLDVRCSRLPERQVPLLKYLLYKLRCITKPRKEPPSIWDKPSTETSWNVVNGHRGPIIDLYGPGTVFHMIRMRDKARRHARARARFLAGENRNRIEAKREAEKAEMMKKIQRAEIGITIEQVDLVSGSVSREKTLFDCHDCDKGNVADRWEEDYTTSDLALTQLEEKIRTWHCGFEDTMKANKRTVKLHRYNPGENQKPKPGKKVFIRKRQPKYAVLGEVLEEEGEEDLLGIPPASCYSKNTDTVTDDCISPGSDTEGDSDVLEQIAQATPINAAGKVVKKRKKDSHRKYTYEDYQALRETLRQRQRTFGVEDGFPSLFFLVLPRRGNLPKTPSKPPHPVTLY